MIGRRLCSVFLVLSILFLTACQVQAQTVSSTTSSSAAAPQVSDFITGLNVPWEMALAPDGRIFLTERPGQIRIIQNGRLQADPWMTIDVAAVGEGGLLGIALDPQFSTNHFAYVAYTFTDSSGDLKNQLVRLREDPANGKGAQDKVLLVAGGGGNHDGGRVKFGPDGKLYWTLGETGNPDLAQDLTSLNGKILRLNSDGTIPEDNPFPGSAVYCYGNRNPEGIAWQPGTNRLYETEHGPSGGQFGVGQDEINYIEAGKNYGWPVIHGDMTQEGMVSPIRQSGPSETWAPAGCTFVIGGPWDGSFLFTGLRGQGLYRVGLDKSDPTKILTFEKLYSEVYGRLRDVVQGPDSTIYVLTNNTDGRGNPKPGDDRILQLKFQ
jgi:glucose/arabinose dehydrogenase